MTSPAEGLLKSVLAGKISRRDAMKYAAALGISLPAVASVAPMVARAEEEYQIAYLTPGLNVPSKIYSLTALRQGREEANPEILPGDIIVVPKAAPVYVTGQVVKPGEIDMPEGGLPLTQVIVKSSANIQSGGRTRLSTMLHGTLILVAVLSFPGLLRTVPLASLAAVLFVVGYKLIKPKQFKQMWQQGLMRFLPFTITAAGVAFIDLLTGVGLGMAVATLIERA